MRPSRKPGPREAAFAMEGDDRFHAIIASSPIRYEQEPDAETILTFFAVRRASGKMDVFHVMKTFKGQDCISRNVQSKLGIPESQIDAEMEDVLSRFTKGIRSKTGFKINWNKLDLSSVAGREEQIKRIQEWGGLRVWKQVDFPLN